MRSENEKKIVGKHHKAEEKTRAGIPFAVTALLVVLALACGCVSGYFVGANFSETAKRLKAAEELNEEYALMVAELYTYEVETDAEEKAAEANTDPDGSAALTGQNVIEAENAEVFVVVEYDGGVITSEEVLDEYEKALADYAMLGEDVSEISDAIMSQVMVDMASYRIANLKAAELGYTQYTEKELKDIDEKAQAAYDATIAFHAGINADEEDIAQVQDYLASAEGYTLEGVKEEIAADYWMEKLVTSVTANVDVDAEDIAALYSRRVEEQTAEYDADGTAFENALMGGEIVVYNPAGYRTVKQICIGLDEESAVRAAQINEQLASELDETVIAQLQAELDGLYAPLEQTAAQAIADFEGGADFDGLIEEYGDVCAYVAGAFTSTGYYVSENTVIWPEAFVETAMALENPGDVSAPVRTEKGVHVVRYIANVQPGSIPLSNVSARLTTETQSVAEDEAWMQQMQAWMEEANVQYYPEKMN